MNDALPQELSLAELINNYSVKFNDVIGVDQHHVSSPLGAWMLLAFLSEKLDNDVVKEALGVDTVEAANLLESMMNSIPAPVAATIHGWINPDSVYRFQEFMDRTRFDDYLEVKFPQEKELDEWLTQTSKGILTKFPLTVDESFMGLFASVLATDVVWRKPLDIIEAPQESAWNVNNVLFEDRTWNISFYTDAEHGPFVVHTNISEDNLQVHSVLPVYDVSADVALNIANRIASGELAPARSNAVDADALKQISDVIPEIIAYQGEEVTSEFGLKVKWSAWLPAWESENEFDVSDARLGFKDAVSSSDDESLDAIQVTKAEYGSKGFKAAALTTVMVGRSVAVPVTRNVPVYEVRFNKPYAVVATVYAPNSPWNKVPVFTGYVKEAVEA